MDDHHWEWPLSLPLGVGICSAITLRGGQWLCARCAYVAPRHRSPDFDPNHVNQPVRVRVLTTLPSARLWPRLRQRTGRADAVPRLNLVFWDTSEAESNLVAGLGRRDLFHAECYDSLHGSPHCPSAAFYDSCITRSHGALVNYAYHHDPIDWRLDVEYVLYSERE